MKRAGLAAFVVVLAALFAPPVLAAFPGRDGLLAVEPLNGSGIVLVKASGRGETRVCAKPPNGALECSLARPEWSPDGRTLATSAGVIYPDGSCLACLPGGTAFTNNPTLLTGVFGGLGPSGPGLYEYGIDGLLRTRLVSGAVSDPAWSSRGELAVVRRGWIWTGAPGHLQRLTRGSAPSWSPDGRKIVFDRRGWLLIGRVRRHAFRRLVRGTAPAWSPDGKWIAFFGKRQRLSVVRASGGRARRVGDLTGSTVDWQPLPAKAPAPCLTPPGSTVIASSDSAIASVDNVHGPPGYVFYANVAAMGCLQADGRERLLWSFVPTEGPASVTEAALAGNYAALAINSTNYKYQQQGTGVELFDLRTGCELQVQDTYCDPSVPDRAGENAGCDYSSSPPCATSMDQLVLGSDAVSAVHVTEVDNGCTCTVEQIQASDSTGLHTPDSVTEPDGTPTTLTNLALTGDTLTWDHNGAPMSAQLQP